MPKNAPRISVVIAFYHQARELSLVLSSFLEQRLDKRLYEIIVVDDHSPDHAGREVVSKLRQRHGDAHLHYVRNWRADGGSYGASAKPKNIGVRLSRGDIVFFNNAEIVQAGETLEFILSEFDSTNAPCCLRGVVLDLPYERLLRLDPAGREQLHDQTSRACERTASAEHAGLAAIHRDVLIRVGGNDERFDYWGKEDIDLAARLKRAGAVYRHDHRLKSFHISHPKNHVKQGDYDRMVALLNENTAALRVEANLGRDWGVLDDAGPGFIQASLAISVAAKQIGSQALTGDIEHLIYGAGSERRQVILVCDERERLDVEAWANQRWPRVHVVSHCAENPGSIMGRLVRRCRGARLAWLPGRPEQARLDRVLARALRGGTLAWMDSDLAGLGWIAPLESVRRDEEWGDPLLWGPRAVLGGAWDHSWLSTPLGDPDALEPAPDSPDPAIATTASVIAVVLAGSDRGIARRSIRALLSQSRVPDALCVFAPEGGLSPEELKGNLERVSFYAVAAAMSWRSLLQLVVAQGRYGAVLATPANTLSMRDRLAVLLDEGETRGVALLRERVIVAGLHDTAARSLAALRLEDEHAAFLATTAALRRILESDGSRRDDALASHPRARQSTSFGISTPPSTTIEARQRVQRLGASKLSHLAGPDILALGA
jgi:GT2 family glycosyltransferase